MLVYGVHLPPTSDVDARIVADSVRRARAVRNSMNGLLQRGRTPSLLRIDWTNVKRHVV
jgi:hypothetical protein